MDMKYGIIVFNKNEYYGDFYEELNSRLLNNSYKDFYFSMNNPKDNQFNYDNNKLYICANNEHINSDDILNNITFTLDILQSEHNLIDISKEYAQNEDYKDLVFEFNFVFMFKNNIINRTYYFIDSCDLLDNDNDAVNNYINGSKVATSNYGILLISVDNDIWNIKKRIIKYLPRTSEIAVYDKRNPASKLLRYRFDDIIFAISDLENLFSHTCNIIDHIHTKLLRENYYLEANPLKDKEYSSIKITFITYKEIYNTKFYLKRDYEREYYSKYR